MGTQLCDSPKVDARFDLAIDLIEITRSEVIGLVA